MTGREITDWLAYYRVLDTATSAELAAMWFEISEKAYWYFLEVLPPATMQGNAYMVGEIKTYGKAGCIRDAVCLVKGRYFMRPAPVLEFSPARYTAEIEAMYFPEEVKS